MSQLEDRLKEKGGAAAPAITPELKSELEKELVNEEKYLADEIAQGRAEEIIVKRKVRIKELKDMLKEVKGEESKEKPSRWTLIDGLPTRDANGEYDTFNDAYRVAQLEANKIAKNQPETKRWTIVEGKPIEDPEGEYSTFAQAYKVASLEAATKIEELRKELRNESGGDKEEVSSLRGEISKLRDDLRAQTDPVSILKRANELTEQFRSAGLIREPAAGAGAGESIDVIKEKNRHSEEMEKIKETRGYHERLTDIAGDAVENVGRGIANQVMEGAEEGGDGNGVKLEYYTCPEKDCGTKIPVPQNATKITCPKCGTIYKRGPETKEGEA